MVLVLSGEDVRSVVTMGEAIEVVEEAFKELALGSALMPTRASISIEEREGWLGVMLAYLGRAGSLSTKIVTVYEKNPDRYGLPTVMATVLLLDHESGAPLAIMEGSVLTAYRTGAVSGVATKYLARPGSRVVGIIGAGVQARTQLMAVKEVRPVEEALVYDTIRQRALSYAEQMRELLGVDVKAVDDAKEAVENADILVTATTSSTPVFDGAWLKRGTHINAIGSFKPTARELDDVTIKRAKVVVDSFEAALAEAGDIIIPLNKGLISKEHLYAQLSEIVAGMKPGRVSDGEITVFKSVGLAIQDAAVSLLAYRKARERGLGTDVKLL